MTVGQSQKRIDGGKIKGPADVPGVIEIKCQVQLPNKKRSFFTFHGFYTTVPSNMQTLATALFGGLSSAWGNNLGLYMEATTAFQNVQIRDMTSHLNPVYIGTGTAVLGTSASIAMPAEAAIVLTENIATRGKGMKGRAYLGGWATNADGTGGVIAGAVQTAMNAFGTAVNAAIAGQGLLPCVAQVARQAYNGITGTPHTARSATHVPVTSFVCLDLAWDSQRRRGQL